MSHHHHAHGHTPFQSSRAFAISTVLNVGFVGLEAAYGLMSGSLALLADAGHNLSDVLGLLLAWGAASFGMSRPTKRHTYGLRRLTILAALANALLLIAATGAIAWEAVGRLQSPHPLKGWTIIGVAAAGVVINTVSALLFAGGRRDDLNIKGAFLHLAADAAVSVGVVIAGILILVTGIMWLDPLIALIISFIILLTTWSLFRESFNLVLDAVPEEIDPEAVGAFLAKQPGIKEVHDLHIWAISTTETALTAHLVLAEGVPDDKDFLPKVSRAMREKFGIGHTTLQIEFGGEDEGCQSDGEGHPCGPALVTERDSLQGA